jgi:hypothetical protein
MKEENKVALKAFFIAGFVFAIVIAGFYVIVDGEPFFSWKLLFHFITFGALMAFLTRKNHLKNKNES